MPLYKNTFKGNLVIPHCKYRIVRGTKGGVFRGIKRGSCTKIAIREAFIKKSQLGTGPLVHLGPNLLTVFKKMFRMP